MSVSDLQARIEEVSADIERQRAVLKKLDDIKSALQGQLNSLRDPVARLPLELSSDIFIQCLPSRRKPGAHRVPMLFLNVCSAWTAIAIATPALWAAIDIVSPRAERLGEVFKTWIPRTHHLPMSLSLRGKFGEDVAAIVRPLSEQLKRLDLYPEDVRSIAFPERIGPLLSLETLNMVCSMDLDGGVPTHQILDALRVAPNLVAWTLRGFLYSASPPHQTELVLAGLRHLRFSDEDNYYTPDGIVAYLTLPALETLYLPVTNLSPGAVTSFLRRSSPPLQKLVIGGPHRHEAIGYKDMHEWLRLVPLLNHLELYSPDDHVVEKFFVALAEPSSTLLQDLQSIKIQEHIWHFSHTSYQALVGALLARRAQLARFELQSAKMPWLDRPSVQPEPDIHATLQELRAEGMIIGIQLE